MPDGLGQRLEEDDNHDVGSASGSASEQFKTPEVSEHKEELEHPSRPGVNTVAGVGLTIKVEAEQKVGFYNLL